MSPLDVGCSECGEPALGTCSRCGRPICVRHRTVIEAGLTDLGTPGILCPSCLDLRVAERDRPKLLEQFDPAPTEVTLLVMLGSFLQRLLGRK